MGSTAGPVLLSSTFYFCLFFRAQCLGRGLSQVLVNGGVILDGEVWKGGLWGWKRPAEACNSMRGSLAKRNARIPKDCRLASLLFPLP